MSAATELGAWITWAAAGGLLVQRLELATTGTGITLGAGTLLFVVVANLAWAVQSPQPHPA